MVADRPPDPTIFDRLRSEKPHQSSGGRGFDSRHLQERSRSAVSVVGGGDRSSLADSTLPSRDPRCAHTPQLSLLDHVPLSGVT